MIFINKFFAFDFFCLFEDYKNEKILKNKNVKDNFFDFDYEEKNNEITIDEFNFIFF